jgi:hypothetical protein
MIINKEKENILLSKSIKDQIINKNRFIFIKIDKNLEEYSYLPLLYQLFQKEDQNLKNLENKKQFFEYIEKSFTDQVFLDPESCIYFNYLLLNNRSFLSKNKLLKLFLFDNNVDSKNIDEVIKDNPDILLTKKSMLLHINTNKTVEICSKTKFIIICRDLSEIFTKKFLKKHKEMLNCIKIEEIDPVEKKYLIKELYLEK